MTPKEKAEQLVDIFEDELIECDTYFLETAKKNCAIIAVDEIINEHYPQDIKRCEYWQEVRQEIKKL